MPKYIITNGVRYLRKNLRGNYYLCDENDATVWSTYKQAQNALNNGLKGWWIKDTFYVEKANKCANSKVDIEKLLEADTSDFNRWLSEIGNFKKFIGTIEVTKQGLVSELSEIDQEICDIRHYIEFGRLNAYQGWAACEMMRTSLKQRRKIKDLLYIITEVQTRRNGITESERAKNAIDNLNKRTYTPRKLDFLFEGCSEIHA